jgi:nitric oxide reductase large subunit
LGTTSFANSSITSVQNDNYVIQQPDKPRIKKKETHKIYTTIYIIFSVLLSLYLILYFVWLRKKYCNKIKRIRNLFENMINTDDITIRIVEN